jgi:hypothetical protein
MPRSPRRGAASLILCGLSLCLLAGCWEGEGVRVYQAPRHEPYAADRYSPLRYTAQRDWEEIADVSLAEPRPAAVFRVVRGGQEAEVTASSFPGPAGGLLANVNRWRGQVGLPNLKDISDQRPALETITVAGLPGQFVDLSGPKGRILGVIAEADDRTWFFKMKGPDDLVAEQKDAFQTFLRSVRFEAGDTNDGEKRS